MSSELRPFLPYGRQSISEADIAAVVEVLRSSFLTQGPTVQHFEQAVATKVGARYGAAVNSATRKFSVHLNFSQYIVFGEESILTALSKITSNDVPC